MLTPKEQAIADLYRRLGDPTLTAEEFDTVMSRIAKLEQSSTA